MSCYDLVGSITGKNYCLNSSAVDVFLKYEPQPTSTKTMVHFAQSTRRQFLPYPSNRAHVRNIYSKFQQETYLHRRPACMHRAQPCATAC
jgi:lysosomal acid lipase/cholesteryl ester hydrolase